MEEDDEKVAFERPEEEEVSSQAQVSRSESESDSEAIESSASDTSLDEEDLDLIAENLGQKRPSSSKQKRFKRIKRRTTVEDDDEEDGVALDGTDKPNSLGRRNLESLFDDDDQEPEGAIDGGDPVRPGSFDYDDDFIVDDDEDEELPRALERAPRQTPVKPAARRMIHGRHLPRKIGSTTHDDDYEDNIFEIFGDGEEYLDFQSPLDDDQQQPYEAAEAAPIEEVFEPAILEDHFLTSKDALIRATDLPERFQLRDGSERGLATAEDELMRETLWICSQLLRGFSLPPSLSGREFMKILSAIVKFFREENYEVPFILEHRKDYIFQHKQDTTGAPSDVDWDYLFGNAALWKIYDLDERWKVFNERQKRILSMLKEEEKPKDGDSDPQQSKIDACFGVFNKSDLSTYVKDLKNIDEFDLQDVFEHLAFHQKLFPQEFSNAKLKTPRATFESTRKIIKIMGPFLGISINDIGKNVRDYCKRFVAEDPADPPSIFLEELYKCGMSENQVIDELGAVLALDSYFRKGIFDNLVSKVTMNTTGTSSSSAKLLQSRNVLDKMLSGLDFLDGKSLVEMPLHEWLLLIDGEQRGLVKIELHVNISDDFLKDLDSFVCSERYSLNSDAWNSLRINILRSALQKHLDPVIKSRAKEGKTRVAKKWLRDRITHSLGEICSEGGVPSLITRASNDLTAPTVKFVVAITPTRGKAYAGIVMNRNFEVVESFGFTQADGLSSAIEKYTKQEFAIVTNQRSVKLLVTKDMPTAPIYYIKDDLAEVYAFIQNDKGDAMLTSKGEDPYVQRYLAGLARRAWDPLVEVCYIGGLKRLDGTSLLLDLPLHPLQNMLTPDELWISLERAIVTCVNNVGVDLNVALNNDYVKSMVPFVCGLGPRKADALLKAIRSTTTSIVPSRIVKRAELLSQKWLGKRVFLNAAAFIKMHEKILREAAGNKKSRALKEAMDPLDSTRIHPDDYDMARKIAADALEVEQERESTVGASWQVEQVMSDHSGAQKLRDLRLEEYGRELEETKGLFKMCVLLRIREELISPYKDTRSFSILSEADMFYNWCTLVHATPSGFGGPSQMFHSMSEPYLLPTNLEMRGSVIGLKEGSFVKMKIDDPPYLSKLAAMYFADRSVAARELDRYNFGQKVFFVLSRIDKDKATLMTHLPTFNATAGRSNSQFSVMYPPKDRSYNFKRAADVTKSIDLSLLKLNSPAVLKTGNLTLTSKYLNHPLFRPFDTTQAVSFLSDPANPPIILRPYPRDRKVLVASLRFLYGSDPHFQRIIATACGSIIIHVKIQDVQDGSRGMSGFVVENEKFEDLDEVVVRYLEPFQAYSRDALLHQKSLLMHPTVGSDPFIDPSTLAGTYSVEHALKEEKSREPRRIPYFIGLSRANPGRFILAWLKPLVPPMPTYEWISVMPLQGFRFRRQIFPTIADLLNWFKREAMKTDAEGNPMQTSATQGQHASSQPSSHYNAHAEGPSSRLQQQQQPLPSSSRQPAVASAQIMKTR